MYSLGAPPGFRTPFNPPRPNSGKQRGLQPRLLNTSFLTHMQAFPSILTAPAAFPVRIPGSPGVMNPRNARVGAGTQRGIRSRHVVQATPAAIPGPVPAAPAAGPTAGFGGAGFGATGLGAGPYTTMRSGIWSPFDQSLRHIKGGVTNVGRITRGATNPATQRNRPAGNYRSGT